MIKNLEALLFLLTQSPDVKFRYIPNANSIGLDCDEFDVKIRNLHEDINFCEIKFSYVSKEIHPDYGKNIFLAQTAICKIANIENFISYCYEQINLTTKDNKVHIEETGINNFLKKQKEVLNVLNDNHPHYTSTVTHGNKQDYTIHAVNKKTGINLQIEFESQDLRKNINFGALQARVIIDGPVLDGFDLYIPFNEISKYKLLRTDLHTYVPHMSEQQTANKILGELAKDLDFFEKIKIKTTLDDSLEPKALRDSRKPKI